MSKEEKEELIEQIDRLMINTISNPKVSTREQIEGYLTCIHDAKELIRGI